MEREAVARALGISRRTVTRKLDRFLERARKLAGGGEP
jgi:DNA-binding transcriptional regulator LsrR (DeoR family)